MSLPSSENPFDGALVETSFEDEGTMGGEMMTAPQVRKQGFSIYSVMLILSFVFLLTAAIMFFVNAGKF